MKHNIVLPYNKVPEEVTTYHCMLVDLPSNGDYHLVAATPIIDKEDIVHHMILFGCDFPGECFQILMQKFHPIDTYTVNSNMFCVKYFKTPKGDLNRQDL